jgi:hypothetical protein
MPMSLAQDGYAAFCSQASHHRLQTCNPIVNLVYRFHAHAHAQLWA